MFYLFGVRECTSQDGFKLGKYFCFFKTIADHIQAFLLTRLKFMVPRQFLPNDAVSLYVSCFLVICI